MKHFDIITLFPEAVTPYAEASILGRAQKAKHIKITAHDLRKYSKASHKKVDDTPYGGGAGMIMTVQPFDSAVRKIARRGILRKPKVRVILTSASGKRFTQSDARRLAEYDQILFLCGRYEGVDERVLDAIADEALSIGDFVITGGELAALVMTDAIARNVPGVITNAATLKDESHDEGGVLEYPQYTKPETYVFAKNGEKKAQIFAVPKVLLSGDHAKIGTWRKSARKKPE